MFSTLKFDYTHVVLTYATHISICYFSTPWWSWMPSNINCADPEHQKTIHDVDHLELTCRGKSTHFRHEFEDVKAYQKLQSKPMKYKLHPRDQRRSITDYPRTPEVSLILSESPRGEDFSMFPDTPASPLIIRNWIICDNSAAAAALPTTAKRKVRL